MIQYTLPPKRRGGDVLAEDKGVITRWYLADFDVVSVAKGGHEGDDPQ